MTVRTAPIFIDGNTHPAEETRQALGSLQGTATTVGAFVGGVGAVDRAHGVVNVGDFAVTANGTPNMSVNVAAGYAWVRGTESQNQGAYHVYNDGTVNLSVGASDATNPRIDLVVIRVQDAFYSGAVRTASITIKQGTPAANPVDPALDANSLVLARIYVAATATKIYDVTSTLATGAVGIINDVRTRAASGSESYSRTGYKNAIINAKMEINQRGFAAGSPITTTGSYGFDRWRLSFSGGTVSYTPQAFALGSGPATGYEATSYAQVAVSGQGVNDYAALSQPIEDVKTFAGGQVTVSFWAKVTTATATSRAKIGVGLWQNFGSGGSPSAAVPTNAGVVTIDQQTAWRRYSVTVTLPTLSGKTIGSTANTSNLELMLYFSAGSSNGTHYTPSGSIGAQTNTFQIWGVQVERGSFPTALEERASAVELALCQRYYWQRATNAGDILGIAFVYATNAAVTMVPFPVTMRLAPTPAFSGMLAAMDSTGVGRGATYSSIQVTPVTHVLAGTSSFNLTAGQASYLFLNTGSLSYSAEF